MNRILNYILNGKGLGLKFLLLFSLIISIVAAAQLKKIGYNFVPEMQNIADKLLPVKIEKGIIIEPNNEIKSIDVNFGGQVFPIVLDTTVDTIDPIGLRPGIYIARKALYSINGNDIRVIDFQQDMELPLGNYVNLFKKVVLITSTIFALFALLVPFVFYALFAVLYAFCAQLIAKLKKKTLEFAPAMRLAVVAYLPTLLLGLTLSWFGLKFSFWLTFAAVLALEYIMISAITDETKQEKPKRVNKI